MSDLSGITESDCARACSAQGCVITGPGGICGHPAKSGLQYADKNAAALARYAEACKTLGVRNQHEVSQ
jgi:hypothetical protein